MKKHFLLLFLGILLTTIEAYATCSASICTQINVMCNGQCNGTAVLCASSGTPPYTYSWSPMGGTSATASNLCAGTYSAIVVDALGCIASAIATITEPPVLQIQPCPPTNVSCYGGSNGCACVTPTGGTPPYTYSWSPMGGSGATACNLTVGSYTCHISDAHVCTSVQAVVITQPAQLFVQNCGMIPPSCNGGNGCATLCPSGGTPPYSYTWNTVPPQYGQTACGLSAGIYTLLQQIHMLAVQWLLFL